MPDFLSSSLESTNKCNLLRSAGNFVRANFPLPQNQRASSSENTLIHLCPRITLAMSKLAISIIALPSCKCPTHRLAGKKPWSDSAARKWYFIMNYIITICFVITSCYSIWLYNICYYMIIYYYIDLYCILSSLRRCDLFSMAQIETAAGTVLVKSGGARSSFKEWEKRQALSWHEPRTASAMAGCFPLFFVPFQNLFGWPRFVTQFGHQVVNLLKNKNSAAKSTDSQDSSTPSYATGQL